MDVAGFLDALCWGNQPAVVDPTVRHARTSLMHSGRLAMVVSRWLTPLERPQADRKRKAQNTLYCHL